MKKLHILFATICMLVVSSFSHSQDIQCEELTWDKVLPAQFTFNVDNPGFYNVTIVQELVADIFAFNQCPIPEEYGWVYIASVNYIVLGTPTFQEVECIQEANTTLFPGFGFNDSIGCFETGEFIVFVPNAGEVVIEADFNPRMTTTLSCGKIGWENPLATATVCIEPEQIMPGSCVGDVNGDGTVGFVDLNVIIALWGMLESEVQCGCDFDGNGIIGFHDLKILLEKWGECVE